MTNTETTKITNKESTETVINKKPAPNNIFSDTESDEKNIHRNKNPEIDVLFTLMICDISHLSSNELNT